MDSEAWMWMALAIVFMGGIILYRLYAWDKKAQELGLELKTKFWLLPAGAQGVYDGLEVEVEEIDHGNRYNRKIYTVYRVEPPFDIPDDLKLRDNNFASKFDTLMRKLTGEPTVDNVGYLQKAFAVTARNSRRAEQFLRRPGVEDFLLELHSRYDSVFIDDGMIGVESRHSDSLGIIESTLDRLVGGLKEIAANKADGPSRASDTVGSGQSSKSRAFGPPAQQQPNDQGSRW